LENTQDTLAKKVPTYKLCLIIEIIKRTKQVMLGRSGQVFLLRGLALLVNLVGLTWAGGTEECVYSLQEEVCVRHLNNKSSENCNTLDLELVVTLTTNSARIQVKSSQAPPPPVSSSEQPSVEPIHFFAQRNGEVIEYFSKDEVTGFREDLMVGLSRLFLNVVEPKDEGPTGLVSCDVTVSVDPDSPATKSTIVKSCKKTSKLDKIYYLEYFTSEKKLHVESKLLVELEAVETFERHLNLNQRIGENVSSRTHLARRSCAPPPSSVDSSDPSTTWPVVELASRAPTTATLLHGAAAAAAIADIGAILKPKTNALGIIGKLTRTLERLSQDQLETVLSKYKNHANFGLVMESCGSIGSLAVVDAVTKIVSARTKQAANLEKFLIALSFHPQPEEDVLKRLRTFIEKYNNFPNIVETLFNTICKLTSRTKESRRHLDDLFGLVGGLKCNDSTCQRRVLMCIAALQTDEFADQVYEISKSAEDKKIREMALATLGLPGFLADETQSRIEEKAWQAISVDAEQMKNEEFTRMLDIVDMSRINRKTVNKLMQTRNKERRAYLAQKIYSSNPTTFRQDYSLQSHSTQGDSVYLEEHASLDPSGFSSSNVRGTFSFATCMTAGSLRRSTFSLKLRDADLDEKQMLAIHTYAGGMSGLVGNADPDDDAEANASLQIYLLGLPLRPLQLFSSMGDLIDFYWSGAGQEKTTLLQGSVPLENTDKIWHSLAGIKVKIQSNLFLHIHSQGEASISIWDSSGSSRLHTGIFIQGSSNVALLVPATASHVTSHVNITTGIQADTQVVMGTALKACVIMSADNIEVEVGLRGRDIASKQSVILPGFTMNLNHKNNMICSHFLNNM